MQNLNEFYLKYLLFTMSGFEYIVNSLAQQYSAVEI